MPRVQMDSNDGPLSKPRGEVHLVPFMMQQAWQKSNKNRLCFSCLPFIVVFMPMMVLKRPAQDEIEGVAWQQSHKHEHSWHHMQATPEKRWFNLTCVGQTPAVGIFSQQAAKCVSVLV